MTQHRALGDGRNAIGRPRKWALLSLLVEAREAFGLKPRQIDVLRGLLTFLPGDWPEDGRAVVFPANRTLTERLHGMPESTMRRHLARLIEAGLLARRSSPSGKRYRVGHAPDLVFGLDLAPFFALAARLAEEAAALRVRRRQIAEARARLRLTLTHRSGEDLAVTLRLVRRRGATIEELRAGLRPTRRVIRPVETPESWMPAMPPKTTVVDAQRERTQKSPFIEPRSVTVPTEVRTAKLVRTLEEWSDRPIRTADDLHETGKRLSTTAGISHETWRRGADAHGPTWTALTVGYVLRRGGLVKRPDRYFAELIRRASAGTFVIGMPC